MRYLERCVLVPVYLSINQNLTSMSPPRFSQAFTYFAENICMCTVISPIPYSE